MAYAIGLQELMVVALRARWDWDEPPKPAPTVTLICPTSDSLKQFSDVSVRESFIRLKKHWREEPKFMSGFNTQPSVSPESQKSLLAKIINYAITNRPASLEGRTRRHER